MKPIFETELGCLYNADCLKVLGEMGDAGVDLVFADPPFNLGKQYGKGIDDSLADREYLEWCGRWIAEGVRVLKPGGAFFLWNLPRWNVELGHALNEHGMMFRHWITVDIKYSLPIPGRLYPSHYSLLYYTKGKPKTFTRPPVPLLCAQSCVIPSSAPRHSVVPNPSGSKSCRFYSRPIGHRGVKDTVFYSRPMGHRGGEAVGNSHYR